MRVLATAALALGLSSFAFAQTVDTITLDRGITTDGWYIDDGGTLYAAGGYLGSELYRIGLDGEVETIATGIGGPITMVRTADGSIYTTDFNQGEVSVVSPEGVLSVFAEVADGPADIVLGPDDHFYVTHYGDPDGSGNGTSVSRISRTGDVETYVSGGTIQAPVGLDFDEEGNLYVSNLFDGRITKVAPDRSQSLFATVQPGPSFAIGHAVWVNGRYYVTHVTGNRVLAFEPDGTMSVVAGTGDFSSDDGPADQASFRRPNGIAASVTGDTLFVSENISGSNRLRRITSVRAVSAEPEAAAHGELRFEHAAPDPFAATTRLAFVVPEAGEVSLIAYDVLGREVERIAEAIYPAGRHQVDWAPTTGVTAGLYVLRLQSARGYAVRTVTRVR